RASGAVAEDRGHPAAARLAGDLDRVAADGVGLVQIDDAGVGDRVALVGAGHLAARLAWHGERQGVQVVDDRLRNGRLAGAELDVPEGVAARSELADIEPL